MARKAEVEEEKEFVNAHVRFPPKLHRQLLMLAENNYLSLNKFIVRTMAERVKQDDPLDS